MKKGYQVTNVHRSKQVGVAAGDICELICKASIELQLDECEEFRLFVAEDGTPVDDERFAALPPQTLFVLLTFGEEMVVPGTSETAASAQREDDAFEGASRPGGSGASRSQRRRLSSFKLDNLFNKMDNEDIYDQIIYEYKKFYINAGEQTKKYLNSKTKNVLREIQRFLDVQDNAKTMLSEYEEHSDWFEGIKRLEVNKSKEQTMSNLAKSRISKYFYKTTSELRKMEIYKDTRGKKLIDNFLKNIKSILKAHNYNGSYFNRKAEPGKRLCEETGAFTCGGLWNKPHCLYDGEHIINPYRSQVDRKTFSYWQLDHKIELSRSIIPKIKESIKCLFENDFKCIKCDTENANDPGGVAAEEYYLQLFTTSNLKLVNGICHDKKPHAAYSGVYAVCKTCYVEASNRL